MIEELEADSKSSGQVHLISVDSAWFDFGRRSWLARVSRSSRPSRSGRPRVPIVPDGCVSVDGAMLRVEPS